MTLFAIALDQWTEIGIWTFGVSRVPEPRVLGMTSVQLALTIDQTRLQKRLVAPSFGRHDAHFVSYHHHRPSVVQRLISIIISAFPDHLHTLEGTMNVLAYKSYITPIGEPNYFGELHKRFWWQNYRQPVSHYSLRERSPIPHFSALSALIQIDCIELSRL